MFTELKCPTRIYCGNKYTHTMEEMILFPPIDKEISRSLHMDMLTIPCLAKNRPSRESSLKDNSTLKEVVLTNFEEAVFR